MAAAKQLNVGVLAAGGAAAFAAYQFVFKPWLAAKSLGAANTSFPFFPSVTTPSTISPAPPTLNPSTGGQYQGSIVDPRVSPGGDVGQAMWRKGWTQAYTTDRLNKMKTAAAAAVAKLAQLKQPAGAPNPQAAALISAGQADLAKLKAIAANDRLRQAQDLAAGDAAGAALWGQAAADHEAQVNTLAANISATAANAGQENAQAITAYESALAGLKSDYLALTGYQLAV